MSGRIIDERYEGQIVFMAGIKNNLVMERKLNGFIQKAKDKLKIRKMCATQKGRHAGSHDVMAVKK